jgi:hypothetical protein
VHAHSWRYVVVSKFCLMECAFVPLTFGPSGGLMGEPEKTCSRRFGGVWCLVYCGRPRDKMVRSR